MTNTTYTTPAVTIPLSSAIVIVGDFARSHNSAATAKYRVMEWAQVLHWTQVLHEAPDNFPVDEDEIFAWACNSPYFIAWTLEQVKMFARIVSQVLQGLIR